MHSDPTERVGRRNRINKGRVLGLCAVWKRSYCYWAWNPAVWVDRGYSWAYTWQKLECTVLQSLGTLSETDRKLSGDYFREQKYGRKPILVGRGKRLTPKRRKWKRVISILDLTLVDDEISARFVCHAYLPLGEDLCPLGTMEIPWALVTSLTAAIAANDQKFLLPGGCRTPNVKWGLVHGPFRRGQLFSLNLLSFWLLDWNSSWVDVEAEFVTWRGWLPQSKYAACGLLLREAQACSATSVSVQWTDERPLAVAISPEWGRHWHLKLLIVVTLSTTSLTASAEPPRLCCSWDSLSWCYRSCGLQPSMCEYLQVLCQCNPLSSLVYINL